MQLTLADELLLLALPEEGERALIGSTQLDCGVAGALLAELALAERVRLTDGLITVIDPSPLGDPDLDGLLQRIAQDDRPRKAEHWVGRIRREEVRKGRLARLAEGGVLEAREHKLLFIRTTYHVTRDPAYEREIRSRLRGLLDGAAADDRSTALLAIVHACRLDQKIFSDLDGRFLGRRVKEVTEDEWAGRAVAKVIASIQAAVQAAAMGAVIAGGAANTAAGG